MTARPWRQFLKGAFFLELFATFGSNFVILISAALGSALAARILGPEKRGEMAAAVAWVYFFTAIADGGISQSAAYYAATLPNLTGSIIGTSTALALGIGLTFSIVGQFTLVSMLQIRTPSISVPTAIYLFSIPFSAVATYNAAVLQGAGRIRSFNLIRTTQALAYTVAIAGAGLSGIRSVSKIMSVVVALQALSAAWGLFLANSLSPFRFWSIEWATAAKLIRFGAKTYLGNLSWLANGRLDQILLSLLAPIYSLGIYAVSVSYSSILFSLSGAIAMVAFPRIAGSSSRASGLQTTWKLLRLSIGISLPLAAGMMLAAPLIVPAMFGKAFRPAVGPAIILIVAAVFLGCNYVLSSSLRALGTPLTPVLGEASGLLITVFGLLWALPRWGIYGAAWVSIASYAATTFILILFVRRLHGDERHATTG